MYSSKHYQPAFVLGCVLSLFLALCASLPAQAAIQEYEFETEAEREQFKKLTAELRCPKCLNSNLAGSDAPVAQELTAEIYRQIRSGRSNDDIVDFMKSRYGDFITYRPPLNAGTFLLWFGPAFLLLAGLFVVWRSARSSSNTPAGQLSDEERRRLDALMNEEQK